MRALAFAFFAAAALTAHPVAAETPTIPAALACETDPSPGLCLLRTGAQGWDGADANAYAVMAAVIHFGVDSALGPDEAGIFAETRAMAEAARREAAGLPAPDVLAPIAALSDSSAENMYRMFASTPEHFIYPARIWRFRAVTPAVIRLALQRARAAAIANNNDRELVTLAAIYAAQGFEVEGHALIRRVQRTRDTTAFWIAVRDFAAAERAIRARDDGDPNPLALFNLAGEAIEVGDNARATRLALEVLDRMVRAQSAELVVLHNRVALAAIAANVLDSAGARERAAQYAHELASAYVRGHDLYGSHIRYALAMLREIGDDSGVCALARQVIAHSEVVGAREVAVELARCGDDDAARVLAARHGVNDFWLDFYLGDPLDLSRPPYAGGLILAIEADAEAGRADRAASLLHILFVNRPYTAVTVLNRLQAEYPEIATTWRESGVFAALRARMLSTPREANALLSGDDLDAVFAAAFSLLPPPN